MGKLPYSKQHTETGYRITAAAGEDRHILFISDEDFDPDNIGLVKFKTMDLFENGKKIRNMPNQDTVGLNTIDEYIQLAIVIHEDDNGLIGFRK